VVSSCTSKPSDSGPLPGTSSTIARPSRNFGGVPTENQMTNVYTCPSIFLVESPFLDSKVLFAMNTQCRRTSNFSRNGSFLPSSCVLSLSCPRSRFQHVTRDHAAFCLLCFSPKRPPPISFLVRFSENFPGVFLSRRSFFSHSSTRLSAPTYASIALSGLHKSSPLRKKGGDSHRSPRFIPPPLKMKNSRVSVFF